MGLRIGYLTDEEFLGTAPASEILSDDQFLGSSDRESGAAPPTATESLSDDEFLNGTERDEESAPQPRNFGSIARGFNRLQQSGNILASELGLISEEDAAKAIARDEADIAQYPPSKAVREGMDAIGGADGWADTAYQIITHPSAIASIIGESLPSSLASQAAGVVASGAGRSTIGLMAGTGLGSFATEYSSTILDTLRDEGVDINDPLAVAAAFSNDALMSRARTRGVKRGVPVATFDAISFGIAGKISKAIEGGAEGVSALRKVVAESAEIGGQAGTGAAGEAGAQLADKGEIVSPGDVLLEGAAEAVTGAPEIAIGSARARAGEKVQSTGIPEGAAPAETLFGEESAAGTSTPSTAADTGRAGPPPPARPTIDPEIERPDSPRLTPSDRASPLPNNLIDDGKRIFEEALAGKTITPTADPQRAEAASRVADIAGEVRTEFATTQPQAATPVSETPLGRPTTAAEASSVPAATPEAAAPLLTDHDFLSVGETNPEPTPGQAEAGNYAKRKVKVHGLDVSVETEAGGVRRSKPGAAESWEVTLPSAYGYVRRTTGADGDQVDVYLGSQPSDKIYVVDQIDPDTHVFDEHKAMIDFPSRDAALQAYEQAFSDERGPERVGNVVEMPVAEFKDWLKNGDTTKPLSYVGPKSPAVNQIPETAVSGQLGSQDASPILAAPAPIDVRQRRAPVQKGPRDIIQFLAQGGGVRDFKGELRSIDARKAFVPGVGKLMRATGMPLDTAREAAAEMGYFDHLYGDRETAAAKSTVRDLLDLVAETRRGNRQYSSSDEAEAGTRAETSREQAQRTELDAMLKEVGAKLTEDQVSEVQRLMTDGMSAEEAAVEVMERDALAFEAETHDSKGQGERPGDDEIPFDEGRADPGREKPADQGRDRAGADQRATHRGAPPRAEPRRGEQAGRPAAEAPEAELASETVETDDGQREQTVVPGAERISEGEQAQRKADEPMRAKAPQKDAGELFDTQARSERQEEMFALRPDGNLLAAWQKHLSQLVKGVAKFADFVLLKQSPVLASVIGGKGKVNLNTLRFRAIRSKHPDIPAAVWAQLPDLIADPRFVFMRGGERPAVVLVGRTAEGSNIIVGVENGEITTITPWDATGTETSDERVAREVAAAVARPGKVYAVSRDALDEILKLTGPNPRARPSSRNGLSHQGRAAKIVTREDVVKAGEGEGRLKLRATESFSTQSQDIGKRLRAELDRLGLKDIGLRISEQLGLTVDGKFHAADGQYFRKLITIALDAENPDAVLDHEAVHALRDVGALNPEWPILDRMSLKRWMLQYKIGEAYSGFPHWVQVEEGIAHAYADWRNGQRMDGIVAKAFKKIRSILQAIAKAFGKDFRTADDVFEQVASGEIGARPRRIQAAIDDVVDELFSMRRDERRVTGEETASTLRDATRSLGSRIDAAIMNHMKGGRNDDAETSVQYTQRKLVDYLQPVKALIDSVGGSVQDTMNAYLQARLADDTVIARIQDMHGTYVTPIIETLATSGITLPEFERYLYARHAEERNRVVGLRNEPGSQFHKAVTDPSIKGASGLSTKEAKAILARVAADRRVGGYRRAESILRRMTEQSLQRQLRAALISQATYKGLTEQWKHWVPLHGDESINEQGHFSPGKGSGFDTRGKEFHGATGRFSEAQNILAWTISLAERAEIRGEHNNVGKAMLRFIVKHDPAGENLARVYWTGDAPGPDGIGKAPDMFQRVLNSEGKVVDRKVPYNSLSPDLFAVKVDGKVFYIEFADPKVGLALKKMGNIHLDAISKLMRIWTGWQSLINTRANPAFIPINAIRDAFTGAVHLLGHGLSATQSAAVVARIPKAWGAIWRDARGRPGTDYWDRMLKEYKTNGGKIVFDRMGGTIEENIRDLQKQMMKGVRGKGLTDWVWGIPVKALADINDSVESGMRLSAYAALRDRGQTAKQAALASRDLTVDFKKHGEIGPAINAWFLFFNAGLQGNLNVAANLAKSRKVQVAAGMIFTSAIAVDMWNRALTGAGGDDDDDNPYLKMLRAEPWKLERSMIIFFGRGENDYISVPLPFGYNAIYHAGLQTSMVAHGDAEPFDAVADSLRVTLDAYNPLGSGSLATMLLPTIATPVIEIYANKNFMGAPIYQERFFGDYAPSSQQSKRKTPELAKKLAESVNTLTGGNEIEPGVVDIPPDVYDYLWGQVSGGIGRFLNQAISLGVKTASGKTDEIEPNDIPILRSLYNRVTDDATRAEYYKQRELVSAAKWRDDAYLDAGNDAETASFEAANAVEIAAIPDFDYAERQIRRIRKEKRSVENDRSMSEEDRRAALKAIEADELAVMNDARKAYLARKQELGRPRL